MAIAQAGERIGFQAAIELDGLATFADVEKAKAGAGCLASSLPILEGLITASTR